MATLTTAKVAKLLDVSPRTVRRAAQQHDIGQLLTARQRIFSKGDIAALKQHIQGKVGNPNFGTGIYREKGGS